MILLTNDDGIYSPGIHALARTLSKQYEVVVVAPDRERSAISHAITMHKPLRISNLYNGESYTSYYVNGTPADCVKLSVEVLLSKPPDFIISGINRGANLGTDIIYSGTVSAAIESHLYGIPAMAVSIEEYENIKYDFTALFLLDLIIKLARKTKEENLLLNINIPGNGDMAGIKGIEITKLGDVKYMNLFSERIDPHGKKYYWLSGDKINIANIEGTDISSIKNKYISITPLRMYLTDYDNIDSMKLLLEDISLSFCPDDYRNGG